MIRPLTRKIFSMNILLTGYKGFIGSHLRKALEKEGHNLTLFEWGEPFPSILEQDWVIHIGAISSTTERDIEKIMKQNYDFTVELYESCRTFGIHFQFASSASLYGLTGEFKETSKLDPRTPYAWSKYLCERYIKNRMGGNTTQIFRYFNVYGPEGEEHKGDQASPYMKFEKQARETGKIKMFENSYRYKRDFIHVSEVVDYHLKFLNKEVSGIFNIGRGETKSFQDVALEIARKYGIESIDNIPMPEELKSSYQEYTCADMTHTNIALKLLYANYVKLSDYYRRVSNDSK